MTLRPCGQRRRNPQHIESLIFYIHNLDRLTTYQKSILLLVSDCHNRGSPFHPTLPELARMVGCSRKTAWRSLQGLDGQHGWLIRDWRGGQKSNVYAAGWRLRRILERHKTYLLEEMVWRHKIKA